MRKIFTQVIVFSILLGLISSFIFAKTLDYEEDVGYCTKYASKTLEQPDSINLKEILIKNKIDEYIRYDEPKHKNYNEYYRLLRPSEIKEGLNYVQLSSYFCVSEYPDFKNTFVTGFLTSTLIFLVILMPLSILFKAFTENLMEFFRFLKNKINKN